MPSTNPKLTTRCRDPKDHAFFAQLAAQAGMTNYQYLQRLIEHHVARQRAKA